jgi:hypothetical protein
MLKRRHIAVLMASLLIGAPVGVAAVSEGLLSSSPEGEYMEAVPGEGEYVATAPADTQSVDSLATADQMEPEARAVTYAKTDESVFPPSTDVRVMLPAEIAYLDRLEASRRAAGIVLIARGDVFPPSTDERIKLPAEIAYLDQFEATRLAAGATRPAGNNPMLALNAIPPQSGSE